MSENTENAPLIKTQRDDDKLLVYPKHSQKYSVY